MAVSTLDGYLGYLSGSTGTVTVTGAGSAWNISRSLDVGYLGSGSLNIEAGGLVSSTDGWLGLNSSSPCTATVTGAGSKWINSKGLIIGQNCDSTLNIRDGGQVSNTDGHVGSYSDNYSTATVTGAGSKWINSGTLYVGDGCYGMLYIQAGGQVNSTTSYLANSPAYAGYAYVDGTGSSWTNSGSLYVNRGELRITAGGQVNTTAGYVGCFDARFIGTATVTGNGSEFNNSDTLSIGDSGNGYLDINGGGRVTAKSLVLASSSSGATYCNLTGGTLRTANILRGTGTVNFNWNDGTIQNYDANTDLTISNSYNLVLKLAATGTHAFNIDLNRTGTIDAVLGNATTGGSLKKIGSGELVLTAVNTYSDATTVEDGRFKVTGSILSTSGINVGQAGILELAKASGSATAAKLNIENAGTVLISAAVQTVGAISGDGVTEINTGASLTAASIHQDTLNIGSNATFVIRSISDGPLSGDIAPVPEPSTFILLGIGAIGLLTFFWIEKLINPDYS